MKFKDLFQLSFRSLIPAWRFFDAVESEWVFAVRPKGNPDQGWSKVGLEYDLRVRDFFLSPESLAIHHFQNLLKIHMSNPEDPHFRSILQDLADQLGKRAFPDHQGFEFRIESVE